MKRIRPISNPSVSANQQQPDLRDQDASREEPFLVPEKYFDDLPLRIMDRIASEKLEKQDTAKPSLRRVWLTAAGIAAVAVVIMMIKPTVPTVKSPGSNQTEASISDEYDPTYADEALTMEEDTITDKEISTIDYKSMVLAIKGTDTTSITSNEVIQYLLDENDDNDLIAGL